MRTRAGIIEAASPSEEGHTVPIVALAAAIALATAFALEHLGGYAPCSLCLYERWPWALALIAALGGQLIGRPRPALLIAGLLLLGNAGLSAYHVGVEAGWFALPGTCTAGGAVTTLEELRAQLEAARPTCDRVALSVFGLSLAAWNGIAAAGIAVLAVLTLVRAPRLSS